MYATYSITLGTILYMLSTADSQLTREGTFIREKRSDPPPPPVQCYNGYTNVCDGCTNIGICAGGETPILIRPCSELTPKAPYCSRGSCSATAPDGVTECIHSFRCSGSGYFPHPQDCTKYYICTSENGVAREYDCGPNYVYKSKLKLCQKKIFTTDCLPLDCSKNDNKFLVYKPDPAYYAFCLNNEGVRETIMYRCFDTVTSEFDINSVSCKFKCPSEGRFPNAADCRSFYECYRVGIQLQWKDYSCPPNNVYNLQTKTCERGSC